MRKCLGAARSTRATPRLVLSTLAPGSAGNLDDVLRRRPFGALDDIELHALAFRECLEALALNCRVMHEAILLSVLRGDEPEALHVVEPLYNAGRTHSSYSPMPW